MLPFFFLRQESPSRQRQCRRKLRSCSWHKNPHSTAGFHPVALTATLLKKLQKWTRATAIAALPALIRPPAYRYIRNHKLFLFCVCSISFECERISWWLKRDTREQPLVSGFKASRNEKNGRKSTPSWRVPPALDFVVSASMSAILFVLNGFNCCVLFTLNFLEFQIRKLHSNPAVMYPSEKNPCTKNEMSSFYWEISSLGDFERWWNYSSLS